MTDIKRVDGRRWDEPRPVNITVGYQRSAEGSALIEMGGTRVLCAASLEERVPPFLRGQGRGWVTAEYSMLPRATNTRTSRERDSGRIQRAFAGNPAAHRAVVAGRHRHGSAGRAHGAD